MPKSSMQLLFHLLLDLQAVRKGDPDQMLRDGDRARKGLADEVIVIGKRVVLQRVEDGIHFIEARAQPLLCLPRVGLLCKLLDQALLFLHQRGNMRLVNSSAILG